MIYCGEVFVARDTPEVAAAAANGIFLLLHISREMKVRPRREGSVEKNVN